MLPGEALKVAAISSSYLRQHPVLKEVVIGLAIEGALYFGVAK